MSLISTFARTTPSKARSTTKFPETGKTPLIADMSSDIASRQLDYKKFAMFYAGAQKNLGPAGVTLVVIVMISWRRPKQACPQCSPTRPMLK